MSDAPTGSGTPATDKPAMDMSHAGERSVAKTDAVVVEVKDLIAGYLPGVNILNSTNLIARQGELIGIIGPNGAGKSTLLKSIFGLVKVRGGEITVNGESIVGLKADKLVKRGVAFVPQTNNVFPSLSIEENLQMGLFQNPKIYNERLEVRYRHLRRAGQAPQAARGIPRAASARWSRCRGLS